MKGMPDRKVVQREERSLPVGLTQEELVLRGRRMGELQRDRVAIEGDFAALKDRHKGQCKQLDVEIGAVAEVPLTGVGYRPVDCEVVLNWTTDRREVVRSDTGEVVEFRPLEPQERQREFTLRRGGAAAEAESAATPSA
jgi:hypothetical protein